MNPNSPRETFFVNLKGDDENSNSNVINEFKAALPLFLKQQSFSEDAVRIEKEYKKFSMVLVECTPEVAELLKQMPGVDSVTENGSKRASRERR